MFSSDHAELEPTDIVEVEAANQFGCVLIRARSPDSRSIKRTILRQDHAEALFTMLGSHLRKPGFTPSGPGRDGLGCQTPHPLLSVVNKIEGARPKPALTIVGKEVDEKTARSCVAVFAGGIDDMGLEGPSPKGAA